MPALSVTGNPLVPESLALIVKPRAQLEEFVGGQMLDRPLDFLHGAHGRSFIPALLKRQLLRPPAVFLEGERPREPRKQRRESNGMVPA